MNTDSKPRSFAAPLLLIAFGLVLRASFFLYPPAVVDSDNALYGLMAKHITEGEFPLFTYGQNYMGALESYVAAFFFVFFGPSIYTLKLAPYLFSGLFLGAVYFLGKELYGRTPALWALAFAAAGPPTLLVWSSIPRGGYSETLFFGTVLLWMAVRIMRLEGGGRLEWAAMGLAAGLGFWTHLLIAYYIIPVAAVLAWSLGRRLLHQRTLIGAGTFLIGSLPFWIYNIPREFETLQMGAVGTGTASPIMKLFLTMRLPELLHLVGKDFFDAPHFGRIWLFVGGAAYLALALPFLVRSFRDAAAFILRRRRSPGEGIFLFFVAVLLFFYASSRFGHFRTLRYLLPLYSVVPFLGAGALVRSGPLQRRIVHVLLLGIMVSNVSFHAFGIAGDRGESRRLTEIHEGVMRVLEETGTMEGVGDYWLGWRLNFLTDEEIIFSEPEGERYLPYQERVEAAPRPAFLVRGNSSLPVALSGRGVRYERHKFRGMRLLTGIEVPRWAHHPLDRRGWRVEGGNAGILVDGLREGIPEDTSRGREFRDAVVDLGRIVTPALARIVVAAERRALPGEWRISSSVDGKEWREVMLHWPAEHVFVSGERAYNGSMFFRCELHMKAIPARYLRLERWEAIGRRLASVEELYLYERAGVYRPTGIDEALADFLNNEKVGFVYADRWESAQLRASLGEGRASFPWNGRHHDKNRNGIVEGGMRAAFVIPSPEAGDLWSYLGESAIEKQADIGGYTVIIADLPEGPTGLHWTGFSLLYEGSAGKALWQRKRAALLKSAGREEEAAAMLREAVKTAPDSYPARLELAELLSDRGSPEGEELRLGTVQEFSPRQPLKAEFEGGARLLGMDIDAVGNGLRLTYYWSFDEPLAEEIWAFVHFDGEDVRYQDDHRLDTIAHPLMMSSENIIKDVRYLDAGDLQGTEVRISLGLWKPAKRDRLRVLSSDTGVKRRALRFSRIIPRS